jgi:hypothetical protein
MFEMALMMKIPVMSMMALMSVVFMVAQMTWCVQKGLDVTFVVLVVFIMT